MKEKENRGQDESYLIRISVCLSVRLSLFSLSMTWSSRGRCIGKLFHTFTDKPCLSGWANAKQI